MGLLSNLTSTAWRQYKSIMPNYIQFSNGKIDKPRVSTPNSYIHQHAQWKYQCVVLTEKNTFSITYQERIGLFHPTMTWLLQRACTDCWSSEPTGSGHKPLNPDPRGRPRLGLCGDSAKPQLHWPRLHLELRRNLTTPNLEQHYHLQRQRESDYNHHLNRSKTNPTSSAMSDGLEHEF
jgi:hypothetical protein